MKKYIILIFSLFCLISCTKKTELTLSQAIKRPYNKIYPNAYVIDKNNNLPSIVYAVLAINKIGMVTHIFFEESNNELIKKIDLNIIPKYTKAYKECSVEYNDDCERDSYTRIGFAFLSDIDTPPEQILEFPKPVYPKISRLKRQVGIVTLELIIDDKGRIESVYLNKSSGSKELDEATLESFQKIIREKVYFKPAKYKGKPVPTLVRQPINYQFRKLQ